VSPEQPTLDRSELFRWAGLAAAGVALPMRFGVREASSFIRPHPRWRFVFVNHATTNPFFLPTRYGIQDACSLFDVQCDWTGSMRSDVGEMVSAMRRAIRSGVDGIAVSLIEPRAFNAPTNEALRRGIPVVAYNADGGRGNQRLSYIGQDLYQSGLKLGARIAALVREGDVFIFIATPGQLNIQPRVDGAVDAIRDSGKPIRTRVVGTGPDVRAEQARIETTYKAHKSLRGMFAVDGGSTQGVAEVMQKYGLARKGVRAGGYDLLPKTLGAIANRDLAFTIDQQPYLQGFLPVFQLFLTRYSGGLIAPAETNTGLHFVTRRNVGPYLTTRTRYEGSSRAYKFPVS
jgi:simple sugar transport system substrate-binding protein